MEETTEQPKPKTGGGKQRGTHPAKGRYKLEKRWEINKGRRMMKNKGMAVDKVSAEQCRQYYLEEVAKQKARSPKPKPKKNEEENDE